MARIKTISDGTKIVVREEKVGKAGEAICFPGLSSCIAIVGVQSSGLVGAHITIGNNGEDFDAMVDEFKKYGGIIEFFVAGQIRMFKDHTKSPFNTRKKIRDFLKSKFTNVASVKFHDLSGGDVHFFVERIHYNIKFYKTPSSKVVVSGPNYPSCERTEINKSAFVVR